MHGLNLKIILLKKSDIKMKIFITLVLTSLLFIAVRQYLRFINEEKLVSLLVYSSFIQLATIGSRIIPYSRVVVVVCPQMRSESGITPYSPQHCSTA